MTALLAWLTAVAVVRTITRFAYAFSFEELVQNGEAGTYNGYSWFEYVPDESVNNVICRLSALALCRQASQALQVTSSSS
jgi:hypothetical protein